MSDMATLQRLGQEFERVGTFADRLRTVPFLHRDVDGDGMMVVSEPLQFIPLSPNTPIRPGSGSASCGVGVGEAVSHKDASA